MNALHIGAQLSKSLLLVNLVQSRVIGEHRCATKSWDMGTARSRPLPYFLLVREISSPHFVMREDKGEGAGCFIDVAPAHSMRSLLPPSSNTSPRRPQARPGLRATSPPLSRYS